MERSTTVNTNDHRRRRPAATKQGGGVGRFTILGSELPGVSGGEISQLRQSFSLRRAESGENNKPRQQQRPTLGRGDSLRESFNRRMTFAAGGNANPLFAMGTSARRLSLPGRL